MRSGSDGFNIRLGREKLGRILQRILEVEVGSQRGARVRGALVTSVALGTLITGAFTRDAVDSDETLSVGTRQHRHIVHNLGTSDKSAHIRATIGLRARGGFILTHDQGRLAADDGSGFDADAFERVGVIDTRVDKLFAIMLDGFACVLIVSSEETTHGTATFIGFSGILLGFKSCNTTSRESNGGTAIGQRLWISSIGRSRDLRHGSSSSRVHTTIQGHLLSFSGSKHTLLLESHLILCGRDRHSIRGLFEFHSRRGSRSSSRSKNRSNRSGSLRHGASQRSHGLLFDLVFGLRFCHVMSLSFDRGMGIQRRLCGSCRGSCGLLLRSALESRHILWQFNRFRIHRFKITNDL